MIYNIFINSSLEQLEVVPFFQVTTHILSDFNLTLTSLGAYLFSFNSSGSQSYSTSSNNSPNQTENTEDKRKRRAKILKGIFKPAHEIDTGQETSNPYIIAMRHFNGSGPVTLDLLNKVLAFHGFFLTQKEFDKLTSLKPVTLPYPLPNNDAYTHSVVGPRTKRKSSMVPGCYVLTVTEDDRQYVGSSVNLSMRLRTYYNTNTLSGRTMSGVIAALGPSAFNLEVYIIPIATFSHNAPMTDAYRAKLILALEQYLILSLKPTLNDIIVVGGGLTKNLDGNLQQAAMAVNSKKLYVYNGDKTNLLYVASSRILFESEVGVKVRAQRDHIKSGKPLLGTYVFTENPVDTSVPAIMTTSEIREAMTRLYLSSKMFKHSVKLTDLRNPNSEPLYFSSKTQALKHTVSKGRPVGKTFMAKLPCTHNGWLVELFPSFNKSPLL